MAIVILPQFTNAAALARIRARHDPLAPRIGAHVTLVFPFESPCASSTLRTHVVSCVQDVAPFRLRCRGFRPHGTSHLFLDVRVGRDEVRALHDRLYSGPLAPCLDPAIPYEPHVTVGRFDGPAGLERALRRLEVAERPFSAVVRALDLVTIPDHGPIRSAWSVALPGGERR